ncbi:hypothetical protein MIMGU_mgv1a0118132mg, partial [Erythranthe guttata]
AMEFGLIDGVLETEY